MNDGVGIGDFALSLLEKEKLDPTPASRNPTSRGDMIDIEHVQVIQEEVDQVLSDAFGFETKEKPRVNSVDERRKQLKEEIKQKVTELKSLLNEFTTGTAGVGSLGAPNFAGGKSNELDQNPRGSKRKARARRKPPR
jgi:hypothetical protein